MSTTSARVINRAAGRTLAERRIAACFAVLACGFLAGAEPTTTTKPQATKPEIAKPLAAKPVADVQDLVFRSEEGLHKVRLHIQVNGSAASNSWNQFLDKAFAYADRNGDGHLSPDEVAKMIQPAAFLQGINGFFNQQVSAAKFADLDANKDGKIDREEFRNYFRRAGLGVVQVNVQPSDDSAERLTKAFYEHVNAKHDGRLTRDDMAAAWDRLAKLDQNEDEFISSQELLQQQSNPFYQQALQLEYGGVQNRPVAPASFISLTPGEPMNVSAAKILQVLQLAKKPYLRLTQIRMNSRTPEFIRSTLRQFDLAVLSRWLEQPPELELDVHLGTISEEFGRLLGGSNNSGVRVHRTGRDTDLERATALGGDGLLRLTLPGDMVEFTRGSSGVNGDPANYYRQQFRTEAGAKQYMSKEEIRTSPQLQFFASIFDLADRDGDGKLFVKEFNAFFDLLREGNVCQINVQVLDHGRGIFDLIDTNHDRRLSRRELLNALKNFAKFDRNGNGAIERDELPRQVRLSVSQGTQGAQFGYVVVADESGMAMNGVPARMPDRGPAWFRKMDRNHDGDVSMREFLGTPEEFKKIDTDGDGLISPEEAERYEKLQKEAAQKKTKQDKRG